MKTERLLAPAVVVLVLGAAAPARAASVALTTDRSGIATLTVVGEGIEVDDLRVDWAGDGSSVSVTGATARAGAGCAQDAATVRCALPARTDPLKVAPQIDVRLGAGDDRLVLSGEFAGTGSDVDGGDGADVLTAQGNVSGGAGNDVLRINKPSETLEDELDGGPGDDRLFANSEPAFLLGGPGADVLHGGPGNDALIDVGDRGSRDTIDCGGGGDVVERDRGDRVRHCRVASYDALALLNHHWAVYRGGLTVPTRLRLTTPDVGVLGSADEAVVTVVCRGAACRGARFSGRFVGTDDEPMRSFKITRGGVRVPGTQLRAVRPGAKIVVSYSVELSVYTFTKTLQFTTRAKTTPRKPKKGCFVQRPGDMRSRRVPCS
jgi:hypothetical protein